MPKIIRNKKETINHVKLQGAIGPIELHVVPILHWCNLCFAILAIPANMAIGDAWLPSDHAACLKRELEGLKMSAF